MSDLHPIPDWALDPEAPYPCPCGHPMMGPVVPVKGEKGLIRLFHPECVAQYLELGEDEDED